MPLFTYNSSLASHIPFSEGENSSYSNYVIKAAHPMFLLSRSYISQSKVYHYCLSPVKYTCVTLRVDDDQLYILLTPGWGGGTVPCIQCITLHSEFQVTHALMI